MKLDPTRLFDDFTTSVFRLETLQTYTVDQEDERLTAFREGRPLPVRSILTKPWVRRMALTSLEGKRWSRVRLVEYPISEYTRYELVSYVESAVVGQDTRLVDRDANPALAALNEDFWLFDAEHDHAVAMLMRYDSEGRFLGSEPTTDPAVLDRCRSHRDLALTHSIPLNRFLAEKAGLIRA